MAETKESGFKKIDTQVYERWFHRIVSHWHLFLISVLLALGGSYLYLRYTNTVYSLTSTVLVKDASESINPLDYSRREGSAFGRNVNLTNEIKVFTSRRLIEETVKKMDWRVSYWVEGKIKNTEIYPFDEFRLVFSDTNNAIPYHKPIKIKFTGNNQFSISIEDNEASKQTFTCNAPIIWNGFSFELTTNESTTNYLNGKSYLVKINTLNSVIGEFAAKLRVLQYDKSSSILFVSTQGTCIERERDFINKHCANFVVISLNDKNQIQERTINFIDEQLRLLGDTLSNLESNMAYYRKRFNSGNVEQIAEKRFMKLEALEEEKAKYALNARYFEYLKQYLAEKDSYTDVVAPVSVGITDPLLNSFLEKLVELKLKQNTAFKADNPTNPFRIENENKIKELKKNIQEIITNIEKSNKILFDDINNRIKQVQNLTTNILDNERTYLDFKRKYKINEELYNLLLKKKSELAITKAGNVADTKIVDYAFVSGTPYPVAKKIYIQSLLVALLIPLAWVLFKYLTNYKIMEKDDITQVCDMPFLGAVGHIPGENKLIVLSKPKSSLAESFRSIRANLYFFMPKAEQKVILITSSLSGEGKTFTSINVASVLAMSEKKVILIGGDMRKPKTYLDIDLKDLPGLSNYLANKAPLEQVIVKTDIENLYFIPPGVVPPNPSELLASQKTYDMFESLKKTFDYIIIDTPPVGLVTDAFPLMRFSDLNIYVIRHNYTQTKFLKDLNEKLQAGLINRLVYIFNDYDVAKNYGYGYRYGYYKDNASGSGYYDDDEKLSGLKKWIKIVWPFAKQP